jgi:hypothetical protein
VRRAVASGAAYSSLMNRKTALAGLVVLILGVAAWLIPEWLRLRQADARLRSQPVYQVLERHEPETYARVREKLLDASGQAITDPAFSNFANAQLVEVATSRLAKASDQAVVGLVTDMVATAQTLKDLPGDSCFRFWFPAVSGPPDIARQLDPAARARTLEAIAEVIRTSAESPVALPANEAVADKLASVVNAMFEQFGTDAQMIAHAEDPRVDRTKVCAMTISLYERILAWPPADSAAIIRAMTQVN